MKYLVTGGGGFIGSNLVNKLLENGDYVRILDKNMPNEKHISLSDNVEIIKEDITDYKWVSAAMTGIDIVVHLAAESGVLPSLRNPLFTNEVNVTGTVNVLEAARREKVMEVIFASSGGTILGNQEPPSHENILTRPSSPYGASKAAGEAYCLAYYSSFGLNTTILRFSNVYGPYSHHKSNIIPMYAKNTLANKPIIIYGDGTQTRDFIYVEDLVNAILMTVESDDVHGEIFQVGSGVETTILDLLQIMEDEALHNFGRKAHVEFRPERAGEVKRNYSLVEKIRNVIGWECKNSLEEGVSKTFKWYLQNSLL